MRVGSGIQSGSLWDKDSRKEALDFGKFKRSKVVILSGSLVYDRILHKSDILVSVGTNCCDDDWCLDTAKVIIDFHIGSVLFGGTKGHLVARKSAPTTGGVKKPHRYRPGTGALRQRALRSVSTRKALNSSSGSYLFNVLFMKLHKTSRFEVCLRILISVLSMPGGSPSCLIKDIQLARRIQKFDWEGKTVSIEVEVAGVLVPPDDKLACLWIRLPRFSLSMFLASYLVVDPYGGWLGFVSGFQEQA
ncbi:hypothetical protein POTOM_021215 [Populus tomentosa]|uniref:Uncharacterized protein n=1 Tax=Populus tomentosa TaxID=118781 RepID=A0A8X7ZTI1_POPTO|nr:hypothetical protein POTOM_021215 [Populus tomentosa]